MLTNSGPEKLLGSGGFGKGVGDRLVLGSCQVTLLRMVDLGV